MPSMPLHCLAALSQFSQCQLVALSPMGFAAGLSKSTCSGNRQAAGVAITAAHAWIGLFE